MSNIKTLTKNVIGVFRGFTSESKGGFIAEVVMPHQPKFDPLLGSFILVELSDDQAVLGRIVQILPAGSIVGEFKLSLKIRLLGTARLNGDKLCFSPGVRSFPYSGAVAYFPTEEALRFICNVHLEDEPDAIPIGHYALGSRVFTDVEVKFSLNRLLSKRTLVFAHEECGKSNLVKLLVSKLYEQNPNVGILIFDSGGQYSFRDAQGLPGLADVPRIRDRLAVFTNRQPLDAKYMPLVSGKAKLDLTSVTADLVMDVCFPKNQRDAVYFAQLKGLSQQEWGELVNLLFYHDHQLATEELQAKFGLDQHQSRAIIHNLTPIVCRLHDPSSHLPQSALNHLLQGGVVVIDVSLLPFETVKQFAGIILKTVFLNNVSRFKTDDQEAVMPIVAIIEEVQNILPVNKIRDDNPLAEWVWEGRKYKLGSILVTQQPSAISDQLMSQSDNFFALYLGPGADLDALHRNNAHFSDDILSYIIKEPIDGNAYFWSAPNQPFVIPVRLFNFEDYVREKIQQVGEVELNGVGWVATSY